MSPELKALIERRRGYVMTPYERREQEISFAWGNLALSYPEGEAPSMASMRRTVCAMEFEEGETVLSRFRAGEIPPEYLGDAIDDAVGAWHDGKSGDDVSLAAFLGMTDAEYKRWVESPMAAEASFRGEAP